MIRDKKIISRTVTVVSPWITLNAKAMYDGGAAPSWYHSLKLDDYVTVLAETKTGDIVLVRQFRPAIERVTLELPGGILDKDVTPAEAVTQELEEETGFRSSAPPFHLGTLDPDTGRLENRLWCFHVKDAEPVNGWRPENSVEPVLMPKQDFLGQIRNGGFTPALHIAIVAIAMLHNRF